ncbi:hypothetical protein F2P56_029048 [Juglans regia]|uniref:Protein kinase domain-containing protein n=2 Tax=Juglans regia TaxID=51240 RepID=A0A833WGJ4_JUGRE|nr:pollen receptor-like kinase 4 [Juglans regia]KAF5448523.1 hypothetical protein F2P56_029048 [Juglans regia]
MGSAALFLIKNILDLMMITVVSLLLCRSVTAQSPEDPSLVGDPQEKEALYDLRATFRDPLLTDNWTGPHCNIYTPWKGIQCSNGHVTILVLENMGLTGNINVSEFINFPDLSVLSFRNNSIGGNIMNFSSNHKFMKRIDLSNNMFSGPIPDSLRILDLLESLQLQNNKLTGTIPEFNQSSLKEFSVSNNDLSGSIPQTQTLQSFGYASYSGNPGLCGPPSPTPCSPSTNDTGESPNSSDDKVHLDKIVFGFIIVLLVVVIAVSAFYCIKVHKLEKMLMEKEVDHIEDKEEDEKIIEAGGRRIVAEERGNLIFMEDETGFEFSDLLRASAEGLGKGSFGNCYKAKLNSGPTIVVKRLSDLRPLTNEEFAKQLRLIADLKHPNLLCFLAYYQSKDEKLLLYRYAEHGNLFYRIHGGRGSGDRVPFRWSTRLSVARGVARGLEYLHLNMNRSRRIAPHGNLKSSNVLLDENDKVLVSDYGFASLVALPIATQRMMSFKSPEYKNAKRVSKHSDVWSYGCLLLELLTGKIPDKTAPPGFNGVDLCSWIDRALREEWTAEVFDPEISNSQRNAAPGMLRLLQIAMRCCMKFPEERPEMTEVVREVELIEVPRPEDEDDLSLDPSLTDDYSEATTASGIAEDER